MSTSVNSWIRVWAPPVAARYDIGVNLTRTERFLYNERTRDFFTGYYSVLVNMNRGVISNGTVLFENSCREGTGFLPVCQLDQNRDCIRSVDCAVSIMEAEDRDIKVYVGFSGTDGSLRPLMSSSLIPTKFAAYSASNMMGKLTKIKGT